MALNLSKTFTVDLTDTVINTDLTNLFNAFSGIEDQSASLGGLKITPASNNASTFSVTQADGTAILTANTITGVVTISATGITPTWSVDVEIDDATKGLILKSPGGTRFRIQVDNTGALTTTSL